MSLRFAARLVPFIALAIFVSAACQQQGEGAPCDSQNGNNDCQSGLTCITPPGGLSMRCCPSSGATSPDCQSSGANLDANTAPTDGFSPESGGDAAQDAPGDSPFEGGSDGASDAIPESSAGESEAGTPVDSGSGG